MMKTFSYPGSKVRIASWILDYMPKHHSYLEPFLGAGAVLFAKEPSRIETVNDLDSDVYNLFKQIREKPEEISQMIEKTPFSRQEYEYSYGDVFDLDPVEQARRFLIKAMQGFGFRTCEKTGWKRDVAGRESAYALRNWNGLPEVIRNIALRLKDVQIENRPAVQLIKDFNRPNVLIYADPPYVLSTRGRKQYKHEMTDQDHIKLLEALLDHKGPVMLSGYDNDLYNDHLLGWEKKTIAARAQGGAPRKEVLWMNW